LGQARGFHTHGKAADESMDIEEVDGVGFDQIGEPEKFHWPAAMGYRFAFS
jgi:hypothetical protein